LPLGHPSNKPPLITLDDYSTGFPQDVSTNDDPGHLTTIGTTSAKIPNIPSDQQSASEISDSDGSYPPFSAVPSEFSSAAASESDLPSALASEPDPPSSPKVKKSMFRAQTGIQDFFRVLSEDDARTMQTKRKRVESEEEFDPVEHSRRKQEKKLIIKQGRNRVNQQRRREKLKKIDIRDGIRDNDGNLIQVS
jgi:hypothetical protein